MSGGELKAWRDPDLDGSPLRGAKIAILGYGSQGRAHALNLRDSAVAWANSEGKNGERFFEVLIGQRPGGRGEERARADGWEPLPVAEAVQRADITVLALPDAIQKAVFESDIRSFLKVRNALIFLHGYNIAAKLIAPPEEVDVLLVAPKGVGPEVRRLYEAGKGVAALTGVHRDATGQGRARALAYAKALGCGRAAVFETTFREEAEVDIFGEQAVLCGGLPALIEAAFETLVEAGYPPELAYFDCCHEVKLIADLMDRVGPEGLPDWISDTAAFGGATRGPRMVPDAIRAEMKEILREIRDGRFSQELRQEFEAGRPATRSWSQRLKASRLASAGARLRQIMRG